MNFNMLYQSHAGSWAILILLFVASVIFKRQKVTPMITRLFYLIMLGSGIGMLIEWNFPLMYVIKGILAVFMIGMMEMIMGRVRRNQPTGMFWIIFVILLALIVCMGYGVIKF
ncbi:hypothetical protein BVG16_01870 [Paenibacillus selenitireducens]|uniref:DUF1516 domain-containing protein n=1 Tax=Paenibacillus selenitireducens TaxID=1324314 RepID=A0A1T2XMK6_9BACL|nr:DUF1516 family protein [Paenibacillus selenitireducens]OPA81110.1 hypothetical protein BVG16_01870 [Paenibacillus selenitireducens]